MEDRQTATEVMESLSRRSVDAYRKSAPFARRVDAIVAHAMQENGPIDPDRAERDAHRIAQAVAAMLLQAIYEDDNELRNLKAERDAMFKLAEDASLAFYKPPLMMKSLGVGADPA